jgi:alpha-glucosidase
MRILPVLFVLAGCAGGSRIETGGFVVEIDRKTGTLDLSHTSRPFRLDDVKLVSGDVAATTEMRYGSFRFDVSGYDADEAGGLGTLHGRTSPALIDVENADGDRIGVLTVQGSSDTLILDWTPAEATLAGFSAACDEEEHFLGAGSHAFDVDHVGEAFPIWVSEPGVGKSESDALPDDWFLQGTRHATSFAVPFLLQPEKSQGWLLQTTGRVDVDLCASDPERFSAVAWQAGTLRMAFFAGSEPIGPVQQLQAWTGGWELPPAWAFAPWNDAVRGPERVREVASMLREAGAPSSVIWSEDWKGAEDTSAGYHLTGEWFVSDELYPDAAALADELEAGGFKWFAYFSPFVEQGTVVWDSAVEAGALIEDANGDPYVFSGVPRFQPTSMVDLTTDTGREWAQGWMTAALDLGFDGWMADYAEWLPTDAELGDGTTGWETHNEWPLLWQQTNSEVMEGRDATYFARSGWLGSASVAPVVWGGDQRTSFHPDDGYPTVLPLGLGASMVGVPAFTHDVAGYQSLGNEPTTKELFFRWAWLGAFSPILRTHHGAFADDNWQLDSDEETLAHWARVARENMRLFPYRYGLAARAAADGTPMILPVAFRYEGEEWGRTDVWMLGDALLVAPVLEEGATGRDVQLPAGEWYDWFTREPVQSGFFDAPMSEIPVFAASGTTVPTFRDVPDTLVEESSPDLLGPTDVDGARVVYLFGGGGPFTEADGTAYEPSGTPSGAGEATQTLTSGTITVAGVTVEIDGPVEREYTVVVVP